MYGGNGGRRSHGRDRNGGRPYDRNQNQSGRYANNSNSNGNGNNNNGGGEYNNYDRGYGGPDRRYGGRDDQHQYHSNNQQQHQQQQYTQGGRYSTTSSASSSGRQQYDRDRDRGYHEGGGDSRRSSTNSGYRGQQQQQQQHHQQMNDQGRRGHYGGRDQEYRGQGSPPPQQQYREARYDNQGPGISFQSNNNNNTGGGSQSGGYRDQYENGSYRGNDGSRHSSRQGSPNASGVRGGPKYNRPEQHSGSINSRIGGRQHQRNTSVDSRQSYGEQQRNHHLTPQRQPIEQVLDPKELKRQRELTQDKFIETTIERSQKLNIPNDIPRKKFWMRTLSDINANLDIVDNPDYLKRLQGDDGEEGGDANTPLNNVPNGFDEKQIASLFLPSKVNVQFDFEPFIVSEMSLDVTPEELKNQSSIIGVRDDRPKQNDKKLVCKHWLRGLCKKGDSCEFLHEYNLKKMPKCWFFSKYGRCDNPECLYLHSDPEVKKPECPAYNKGFCYMGPRCQFLHITRALCPNYICGFCPEGPKCKFGHPH